MDKRTICRKSFYLLFLLVLASVLAGCMSDPNEKFIQGVWSWDDPHFFGLLGESHSIHNWLFDYKTFQYSACCFVQVSLQGKYHIISSEDNEIQLELFDLSGDMEGDAVSPDATIILTIKIDRENDQAFIDGSGPFTRLTPSGRVTPSVASPGTAAP